MFDMWFCMLGMVLLMGLLVVFGGFIYLFGLYDYNMVGIDVMWLFFYGYEDGCNLYYVQDFDVWFGYVCDNWLILMFVLYYCFDLFYDNSGYVNCEFDYQLMIGVVFYFDIMFDM